jgi:hypothetical protein
MSGLEIKRVVCWDVVTLVESEVYWVSRSEVLRLVIVVIHVSHSYRGLF